MRNGSGATDAFDDYDRHRRREPDAWLEPVDFLSDRERGAPQLKERHVPPSLWPFIADTATRLGVATSSVAMTAIVSCAAAIGEEWQIQPKRHDFTWTEAARLWGGIVGPPSILKSPVIAMATAPIVAMEVAARKAWSEQMVTHRAALAAWKADGKADDEPRPPRMPRYLVESATIEALQEVLRDDEDGKLFAPQGKVLIRQDELSEFLAGMDRYSTGKGSDRGAYLRAYNGGRFTIDRIGRGSFAANSWSVCLIGGIQPEPIQRIATQAVDDGILQRMMLDVPPPQGIGKDQTPDRNALNAYQDIFPALAALRPVRTGLGHPTTVALHADAHAAREDVDTLARVMAAMPDTSPRLQSTFGKWHGLFARLCLTYHLVEVAAARSRGEIGPPAEVVSLDTAARVRSYMRQILAPNLVPAASAEFVIKRVPWTNNADLSFLMAEIVRIAVSKMSWEALGWSISTASAIDHRYHAEHHIEFFWGGPSPAIGIPARRIDQALYDLIANAKHEILLITFAAAHVGRLTRELRRAAQNGARIRLILEFEESSEGQLSYDAMKAFPYDLIQTSEVYYWPISKRERNPAGRPGKLHAKVAIVDDTALIFSANLTDDAFNRNLEIGIMVTNSEFLVSARTYLESLIINGTLCLLSGDLTHDRTKSSKAASPRSF